jgi:hypothetical protein
MRPARIAILSASVISIVLAGACSLNPQPIPPGDDNQDAGSFGQGPDGGRGGTGVTDGDASPSPNANPDAASDGNAETNDAGGKSDGGDGSLLDSEAGDAAADADADGA